jgi:hypothetical protein
MRRLVVLLLAMALAMPLAFASRCSWLHAFRSLRYAQWPS